MWPFKKTILNVLTVHRDSTKLRLSEWQADENLTNSAGKVLVDPVFQMMVQVAKNESPSLMALTIDCPLETRALHQARIEGYNMALRNIDAMASHKPLPSELVATFEDEEKEEQ